MLYVELAFGDFLHGSHFRQIMAKVRYFLFLIVLIIPRSLALFSLFEISLSVTIRQSPGDNAFIRIKCGFSDSRANFFVETRYYYRAALVTVVFFPPFQSLYRPDLSFFSPLTVGFSIFFQFQDPILRDTGKP